MKQLVSTGLLLCLLLSACQTNSESEQNSTQTPDLESAGITGIIQSSGLQQHEAQARNLPAEGFQLVSQQHYFLVSDSSLQAYWGQCVTVFGYEAEADFARVTATDTLPENYPYNRKVFRVDSIAPQVFSFCAYSDSLPAPANLQFKSYQGLVQRRRRPAPDIAYDYSLHAQQAYLDASTGEVTNYIGLYAANFEVISQLENAIKMGQKVQLRAAEQAGYAEQTVLYTTEAQLLEGAELANQ